MILPLISKLCWAIRHVSLAILNFIDDMVFDEFWAPLHYSMLAMAVFLPMVALLLWCCLAFDEWWMEEDSRGYLRRVLHEAEEARKREEMQGMDRKER
mmetsp:Transcript_27139/g.57641  ORF Transcript_27139/g.57641 Transcript_27139/m.57641 type:complete len:98 (-) Transcript_27139:460-753(-)